MNTGTQLGVYRIDGLVGQGGMAQVYRVWHTGLHRAEALKLLPPHLCADRSFVERFLTEARTAARLHHPHIASIYTVSDPNVGQPYFTMELVEGRDLSQWLHQKGRLSLSEALPLLEQIASALDYAHSQGVVHRDIKPANVLLHREADGHLSVKLVDFGIARAQEAGGGARLTKTGMLVGTPEYMSPEQAEGRSDLDARTDQYSLGIVAYEMLTGRTPFAGEAGTSALSVLMRHIRDLPPPPTTFRSDLPMDTEQALLRVLAKTANQRFGSCMEFVRALAPITGARRADFRQDPVPPVPPVNVARPDYRLFWAITGLLSFVGVVLVGFSLLHGKGEDSKGMGPSPVVSPKEQVKVPDLVGAVEETGHDHVKALLLGWDATHEHSASQAGHIVSQTPPPGSLVDKGTGVHVVVSTGPEAGSPTSPGEVGHNPSSGSSETPPSTGGGVPSSAGDIPGHVIPDNKKPFDPPPITEAWEVYEDVEHGFRVEYPRGWKMVSVPPSSRNNEFLTRIEFLAPEANVKALVECSHAGGETAMQSWKDQDRRYRLAYKSNYHLLELTPGRLDGVTSAYWHLRWQKPGEPELEKVDIGAVHNRLGYAVLYQYPPASAAVWQPTMEHFRSSFHFLP